MACSVARSQFYSVWRCWIWLDHIVFIANFLLIYSGQLKGENICGLNFILLIIFFIQNKSVKPIVALGWHCQRIAVGHKFNAEQLGLPLWLSALLLCRLCGRCWATTLSPSLTVCLPVRVYEYSLTKSKWAQGPQQCRQTNKPNEVIQTLIAAAATTTNKQRS